MPAFFSHVKLSSRAEASATTNGSTLERDLDDNRAALARPPRHSWNHEQRVALCVLRRWFSPNDKDIHLIFNKHYTASIQQQNPGHQIARNTLLAQLHDMERDGDDNEAWRSVVLETTFEDPHGYFENTRQDLEKTASDIGITLLRGWEDKYKNSPRSGSGRSPRKRKRQSNAEGVLGHVLDVTEEDQPCTPTKRRSYGLLTPPTSAKRFVRAIRSHQIARRKSQVTQSFTPEQHDKDYIHRFIPPDLGFRFWDNNSHGLNTAEGFRAGAFVDRRRSIPSPPDRYDQVFRDQANIHLQPLAEPSSYISVWEGILPAFHRGLRSSANAHVAFINLRAVYAHQLSGIPALYPAAHVIKQFGMVLRGNYRGRGDWLVWGEIERSAVVACFTVEDFRRFMHSIPKIVPTLRLNGIQNSRYASQYHQYLEESRLPISRASGKIVGKLLAFAGLPEPFVNFGARKVALTWYFEGWDDSQRYKSYLDGVHSGFKSQLAITEDALQIVPAPMPSITASLEPMTLADTFQLRRAAIESIIGGSGIGTDGPGVQVWQRQIIPTARNSEAETQIDGFLLHRKRIEAILQASHTR